MTPLDLIFAVAAGVAGLLLSPWVSWAIRSWPGHEDLLPVYHDCTKCSQGMRRRCVNAGRAQDRWLAVIIPLVAVLAVVSYGVSVRAGMAFVFTVACLIITIVDIRYLIIPDVLSIGGIYAGLAFWAGMSMLDPASRAALLPTPQLTFLDSVLGALVGWGFLWMLGFLARLILRKEGMGGGDVKLLAAFGAWLGWQVVAATVIVASVLGSVGGIGGILWQRLRYGRPYSPFSHMIPFGPYLCIGFLFVFFAGLDPLFRLLELWQGLLERTLLHR